MWREARRYEPRSWTPTGARTLIAGWRRALERARGWAADEQTARAGRSCNPRRACGVARASVKPQVYIDPRPAEHFDEYHARVRARRPDWVYPLVRMVLTPP